MFDFWLLDARVGGVELDDGDGRYFWLLTFRDHQIWACDDEGPLFCMSLGTHYVDPTGPGASIH